MDDLEMYKDNSNDVDEYENVKKMNFFQRIMGIIFSPTETMKSIAAKPRILFPIALVIFFTALTLLLVYNQLFETLRQTLEETYRNMADKLPKQPTATEIYNTAKLSTIGTIVGMPFTAVALIFAASGIYFGALKIFGAKGSYKQFLSITLFAYVFVILQSIIGVVATILTNKYDQGMLVTSLASLVDKGQTNNILYACLQQIEIFKIWRLIVLGIGFSIVSKLKMKTVYIVLFVLFLLQLAYGVGSVALQQSMM